MMNQVTGSAFKLQLHPWYIFAVLDFYFSCQCYWPHAQNALSQHLYILLCETRDSLICPLWTEFFTLNNYQFVCITYCRPVCTQQTLKEFIMKLMQKTFCSLKFLLVHLVNTGTLYSLTCQQKLFALYGEEHRIWDCRLVECQSKLTV